jgi:DnaJ-domain-containing protein 1
MSYSQIFRRLSRILRSQINDMMDGPTPEQQDLSDFDEELKRDAHSGNGTSTDETSSSGGAGRRAEGRHRPGERDDAYYYGVLGLTPDASVEEIRSRYRKLMATYHPDRAATASPEKQREAEEKASAINEAYHIIERRRGFN